MGGVWGQDFSPGGPVCGRGLTTHLLGLGPRLPTWWVWGRDYPPGGSGAETTHLVGLGPETTHLVGLGPRLPTWWPSVYPPGGSGAETTHLVAQCLPTWWVWGRDYPPGGSGARDYPPGGSGAETTHLVGLGPETTHLVGLGPRLPTWWPSVYPPGGPVAQCMGQWVCGRDYPPGGAGSGVKITYLVAQCMGGDLSSPPMALISAPFCRK